MSTQILAASGLVQRVLGDDFVRRFAFEALPSSKDDNDQFVIRDSPSSDQIHIRGSSGVALASGFYW
jgi:hypothetical protein